MVKVELDLFQSLLWQIFERVVAVSVVAVVGWDADDFIINFAAVDEFHNAKDFGFHPNAGGERLVGNHENVEFVAVFIDSLWNKTVVAWFGKSHWLNAVEHKASVLAIPFDFMIAASRDFNDDVQFAIFIIPWGQNFIKVCHNISLLYILL